jgi:hypothetical protein
MALVKAGADVRCTDNSGCGFSRLHRIVGWFLTLRGGRSVLCRLTALHHASNFGHTETALALVRAGADVHGKNSLGYGSRASSSCRLVSYIAGADGPSAWGGAEGGLASAVQVDGAALCVAERPHGDGAGAAEGGRGRARQGQQRVRSSGCILVSLVCHSAGRTFRPLGVELQEWLVGLCLFGRAGGRRCTGRRRMATRRRRWRWPRRARTCTARTAPGTVPRAASSCRWVATVSGRTVRPLGVERQECVFWLCRMTALHRASWNGHTATVLALAETAMAIFLADARTLCPSKDRYGSRAASGHSGEPHFCRQCPAGGLRQLASRALSVCQLCIEMICR